MNAHLNRLSVLTLGALLFVVSSASAQPYALRADVVASGATDATGGGLRLRATVGEPIVGPIAGGAFAAGQGFWYPAALGDGGSSGPLVDLTLTPLNPPPPVVIARGATLRYRADFAIAANGPSSFQYWAELTMPNGQTRFLFGPITVVGTPGTTVASNLKQRVPRNAQLGDYVFRMMVGEYPAVVYDEDSFPMTVTATEALAVHHVEPTITRGTGQEAALVGARPTAHLSAGAQTETTTAPAAEPWTGTLQAAAPAVSVFADMPPEIARRIAAAPDEWLAWDEDGALLVAGLVQDFRFAAAAELETQAEADSSASPGKDIAEPESETAPPASAALPFGIPTAPVFAPPFPNPFGGAGRAAGATLRFGLPEAGAVRLAVYDVRGRRVALLLDGERAPGWHEALFSGQGLASGLYVARLEAAGRVLTHRLTLLR